jgi:hypothetical protein
MQFSTWSAGGADARYRVSELHQEHAHMRVGPCLIGIGSVTAPHTHPTHVYTVRYARLFAMLGLLISCQWRPHVHELYLAIIPGQGELHP